MRLIPNAKDVAKRAWSMRLIGGGVALQVAAELVPYVMDAVPLTGAFRVAAIGVTALAAVARLVKQEGLSDDR